MNDAAPKTIFLAEYTPPAFLATTLALRFDLDDRRTIVRAESHIERNPAAAGSHAPLLLDGVDLQLVTIKANGRELAPSEYTVTDETLTVHNPPDSLDLHITTIVNPRDNTSLEGLYKSGAHFCTQCEAQGFRKITYFLDRPDVLCRYETTLVADKLKFPVLLSNGNPVASGEEPDGRHWVTWRDPFPKPTYLFALVAGDLAIKEDQFRTRSGRDVALRLYVEHHNADRCDHAMASLIKAMRWDEDTFGLEYDLDIYMIVAVDDFNMGAMENKGLNIFNSKYVLARPDTATDADYAGIEGVIAHEYFHNWTGNRVTCRDWFQLSLKEGLTVFRDQEFSSDAGSRAVKRIHDVRLLRGAQFAEDAGPMAHPVRPASYMEISNFYTVTIYNKGAEVIRMIHTLIGPESFRRGLDLYFERHDGQAVTTEDFVAAMADASGEDLEQFKRWYDQAGTPVLHVTGDYDPAAKTYSLVIEQSCPPTPELQNKKPFHIPVKLALLDPNGESLPLNTADGAPPVHEHVLNVRETRSEFVFQDIAEPPVPSVLRGFSAPVKLDVQRDDADLALLLAHDSDSFNRWDAGQELAMRLLLAVLQSPQEDLHARREAYIEAVGRTLRAADLDRALIAEALVLPSEGYIGLQMQRIDPDAIHRARRELREACARTLREDFMNVYQANQSNEAYRFDPGAVGRRSLKNICLDYLLQNGDEQGVSLAAGQFHGADNMTDTIAALKSLSNVDCAQRQAALEEFYDRWRDDPLVLDKWFTIQATSDLPGTLTEVESLLSHRAFDLRNPNKVRALIGAFSHGNQVRFHAADGSGYRFLADRVLELDSLNPQVAARLVGAFNRWRQFENTRASAMHEQIERVLAHAGLSRDTYEVAYKALA